ncbi:hypothetical protein PVK62_07870 [Aliivibrio sp. S3MY1]|uniref:Uncharacterized protein n=1 Tax=Aliivibrio wodanis TaxID=80852 RepID=A0A5Q4ZYV9_9GAMM|nr:MULTISPECIES: hypothetical protein [Aliivibrio]MDD9176034.1 hypothetical protein [Aliivibrio sp. S3TY1]MDD9193052.1 hypothetical protein [Aliivibrio sp. S2TY2]MDD9195755.1 hypothetical protein [Aliivibrio sp. S3MY1]VVV07054.1 hypothetical protein AW0309160_04548 [Aliivibrio wodanis]
MYHLALTTLSTNRFSVTFRAASPFSISRYFNISIEETNCEDVGTLLSESKKFTVELCHIEEPTSMTCYTLKKSSYCSAKNVFSYIANLLTELHVVPKGVPVVIEFDLHNKHHSMVIMNAGLEPVLYPYESMMNDKKWAINLLERGQKELSQGCRTKGNSMIQLASRIADAMGVYQLNPFDDKKHGLLYDMLNRAITRHIQA